MTSNLVPAILNEYGATTRAALRKYLPTHEPRRHLYDLVADYPLRGGKMMRPSLCIAAARAFGASTDDVLDTAYDWLCWRRREYSANSDVWAFRRCWPREKEKIKEELQVNLIRAVLHQNKGHAG